MKTIKVGQWFSKLSESERAFIVKYAAAQDFQYLRSFLSTARKSFPNYEILSVSYISINGQKYYFSYDRKEFCKA